MVGSSPLELGRGTFQGDNTCSSLSEVDRIPSSQIVSKVKAKYEFAWKKIRFNSMLFANYSKSFNRNDDQRDVLLISINASTNNTGLKLS